MTDNTTPTSPASWTAGLSAFAAATLETFTESLAEVTAAIREWRLRDKLIASGALLLALSWLFGFVHPLDYVPETTSSVEKKISAAIDTQRTDMVAEIEKQRADTVRAIASTTPSTAEFGALLVTVADIKTRLSALEADAVAKGWQTESISDVPKKRDRVEPARKKRR